METVPIQSGPQVEEFVYPASQWTEEMAGLGERLEEIFPAASRPSGGPARTPDRMPAMSWQQFGPLAGGANPDQSPASPPIGAEWLQEFENRLVEECRRAEERGRMLGMDAGLQLGREEAERHLAAERARLTAQAGALTESFLEAQAAYFHRIEGESVELALAIAARILRREAQVDPLVLLGSVRVALGQLAESTAVRLLVPSQDQPMWEQAIALHPGLRLRPQVLADERMELGDCRLEAEIGSVDLGIWSQLKEMERGFFDRAGNTSPAVEDGTAPNPENESGNAAGAL